MFIPATKEEAAAAGIKQPDVVLITGDAYIDAPSVGISVIGHVLIDAGFKVCIIAQPAGEDICRFGEPRLFWGVTAGAMDSMVSNYNADRSRRRQDDLSPEGGGTKRPDRACIAYTNLIRRYYKNTAPVILGGLEASLRRIAHYDYWQNKVRRSVLFDAKADAIVYGMGELSMVELANRIAAGKPWQDINGICYAAGEPPQDAIILPSYEEVCENKAAFWEMFKAFAANADAAYGRRLAQQHGDRWLVQNPPARDLTSEELDRVYEFPYERDVHPAWGRLGRVRALDTIRFSITTHRGCAGGCSFCSIAVHQGKSVISRSEESIIREAERLAAHRMFRGTISDVGGPTANMYGASCLAGGCARKLCLGQKICPKFAVNHGRQIALLAKIADIAGVKHAFVASGIRYDLVLADKQHCKEYLQQLAARHISGLLRVAPEHTASKVLALMGKPKAEALIAFTDMFADVAPTGMGLSYYFMAAHPGCTLADMRSLSARFKGGAPASVQIFTPTPSTLSTAMYYTGTDALGNPIFVERDMGRKQKQKRTAADRFRQ